MEYLFFKPTKQDLQNAKHKTVPDVIDYNLKILFCGINPGLYTAAVGHHFARPGNRFWKSLYESGFTPRLYSPFEDQQLLTLKIGITNLVNRATNTAAELSEQEYQEGRILLEEKIEIYKPKWVAFVGLGAYRSAFKYKNAKNGRQETIIRNTQVWVLPSTSGLNAGYTPKDLENLFKEFKNAVDPTV